MTKTKVVKLKAGLGNQMFQYAFSKLLEKEYGCDRVLIDVSYYDHPDYRKYLDAGIDLMRVKYKIATKSDLRKIWVPYNNFRPHHFAHRAVVAFEGLFNPNYYFEKDRSFVDVSKILKNSYLDGYWQSWRYLEPVKDILIADFTPKEELSISTREAIDIYKKTNSVFVGVRRGDYAKSKKSVKLFGAPSLDYYKRAIQIINEKVKDPYFVVFSDDIQWVKEHIDFVALGMDSHRIEYRENIHSNFEELFLMSSCKHAIISNSTFNFWGAWLIRGADKVVVAPNEWFKDGHEIDIIPPDWIKI